MAIMGGIHIPALLTVTMGLAGSTVESSLALARGTAGAGDAGGTVTDGMVAVGGMVAPPGMVDGDGRMVDEDGRMVDEDGQAGAASSVVVASPVAQRDEVVTQEAASVAEADSTVVVASTAAAADSLSPSAECFQQGRPPARRPVAQLVLDFRVRRG